MLPNNTLLQGRYLIVEQIGRGGMGAVYKATDTRLRNTVALKQTLVEGEALRKAFEREAQLLAGLRHPTLPRVSDHFIEGDGQYLVMEFIPGDDLAALLLKNGGPFELADVARWADQLLDALHYLHSRTPTVIHRDIKPQNTKQTPEGDVVLLDFGLAKGAAAATRATSSGSVYGYTPHYAPLEQIRGEGTDPRSDLYSLAATLYHLLTGSPPPDALSRAAARINEEPDPLLPASQINPLVPASFAMVLQAAMAQKPDQRPPSAAAMRAQLRAALRSVPTIVLPPVAGLPEATPLVMVANSQPQAAARLATGSLPPVIDAATGTTVSQKPAAPPARSRRWVWLAAGGLLAVFVAGGGLLATRGGDAPTPTTAPAIVVEPTAVPSTTPSPTALPTAVNTPNPDEIVQTAIVIQTAQALKRAADLATARALVSAVDGNATQTAIALTPTATPLPATEAPSATQAAAPTVAAPPSNTPRPAPTRDANAPTATPRPSATPRPTDAPAPPPSGVIDTGSGSMFRGTANLGKIAPEAGDGGACIEGRVTTADGGLFSTFGVQIDNRGNTRSLKPNVATGTYRICGLAAGEWGVSIFQAGGVDIPPSEQVAHQVRVQLSGTPGEVYYINFQATPNLSVPTATAAPQAGPYDGQWAGSLTGTTTTGSFTGNFRMEIRANAVYRISVDGASCFFDTYPNFPKGQPIGGNGFSAAGPVFNPQDSSKGDISYAANGTFTSDSSASGTFNANQGGNACIVGSWSASKVAGP